MRILLTAGLNRFGIRSTTINRRLGSVFPPWLSSESLTGPFFAVGCVYVSSLILISVAFGGVFFIRCSSASISGGRVGERRAGSRTGDLCRLAEEGGSSLLGFGCLVVSATSSRFFFASFSRDADSLWSCFSKLRRNGDNNGGTKDFESALVGVCRLLVEAEGRAPLGASSRGRDAGEAVRLELDGPLRTLRPFVKELEVDALPSLLDIESRAGGNSRSLRLCSSSRRCDWDGSSEGRPASGLERFCDRVSSLLSAKRFLFSGDGGRGGSELLGGGFGGSLRFVSHRSDPGDPVQGSPHVHGRLRAWKRLLSIVWRVGLTRSGCVPAPNF